VPVDTFLPPPSPMAETVFRPGRGRFADPVTGRFLPPSSSPPFSRIRPGSSHDRRRFLDDLDAVSRARSLPFFFSLDFIHGCERRNLRDQLRRAICSFLLPIPFPSLFFFISALLAIRLRRTRGRQPRIMGLIPIFFLLFPSSLFS